MISTTRKKNEIESFRHFVEQLEHIKTKYLKWEIGESIGLP